MSKFKVGDKVQVVSERGVKLMSEFKLDGNSTVGEVADTHRYRCPDGATVTMQYAVHFHRQQTENGAFVRLWFHENELKLHQSETDCADAPEAPLTNAEIKALRLALTSGMFSMAPATETQQEQSAEPLSNPCADWPHEFEDLFNGGLLEKVFIRGKHDLQRSLFLHGYRAGYNAALRNESGSTIQPSENPEGGQSDFKIGDRVRLLPTSTNARYVLSTHEKLTLMSAVGTIADDLDEDGEYLIVFTSSDGEEIETWLSPYDITHAALKNESDSTIQPSENPEVGQSKWVNLHITEDNPLGIYVGAKVRLRDGTEATIELVETESWAYPIRGRIGSHRLSWTRHGSYHTDDGENQYDIIEVLQPEAV